MNILTKQRISERDKNPRRTIKTVRPHNQDILKRTAPKRTLIDTSNEKFKNSPGLTHWANIQNLKTAAASYAEAENLTELRKKIDDKNTEVNAAETELVSTEKQLKELKEIQHFLNDYKENRPYKMRYEKSKDPDRYLRMHEMQLILFDGAKNWLQNKGIRSNISELEQVNKDVKALEKKEAELEKKCREGRKSVRDLEQKYLNITQYLGIDNDLREAEHIKEAEKNSDRTAKNQGVSH